MRQKTLCLFPDTNLFLQGKTLSGLDWSIWGDFAQIRIVVSDPVQREIDDLKKGYAGRRTKLARRSLSLFRTATLDGHVVVVEIAPQVRLYVEPHHAPTPGLSDMLDYGQRDDQLVGIVDAYSESHPTLDVRLLTHDGAPLSRALSLGIQAEVIPDSWLLPPERSPQQKQIDELKAQILDLRGKEPVCQIDCVETNCVETNGTKENAFTSSHAQFKALTQADIDVLLKRLQDLFPLRRDFNPKGASSVMVAGIPFVEVIPVTEDEVTQYQQQYSKWIDTCRVLLEGYHKILQTDLDSTCVRFHLTNVGKRPAKDASVRFLASGDFIISEEDRSNLTSSRGRDGTMTSAHIPTPPRPPEAQRITLEDRLANPVMGFGGLGATRGIADDLITYRSPLERTIPATRDKNTFYREDDGRATPKQEIRFECQQWRHKAEPEQFVLSLHALDGKSKGDGLLTCRIEAENLSDVVEKRLPIRMSIEWRSTLSVATAEIDRFARGAAQSRYRE